MFLLKRIVLVESMGIDEPVGRLTHDIQEVLEWTKRVGSNEIWFVAPLSSIQEWDKIELTDGELGRPTALAKTSVFLDVGLEKCTITATNCLHWSIERPSKMFFKF